jgi:hypothetical protein
MSPVTRESTTIVPYAFGRCILTVLRYSTALLIGEKCAMLVAEDLGYSGEALDMKVPNYHAPGELNLPFRV